MAAYSLKLLARPYEYGRAILLELPLSRDYLQVSNFDKLSDITSWVYSDYVYSAEIQCDDLDDIQEISVSINGVDQKLKNFYHGKIEFYENRIFMDNFGLAQISVSITYHSGEERLFYSPFVSLLINDSKNNLSVQKMVEYIYGNYKAFLFEGESVSRKREGIKPQSVRELEAQIQILKQIIVAYDENARYFQTNAKFTVSSSKRVDHYEKVKYVTSSTIQFIVQHPEELKKCQSKRGIKIGENQYLPSKTLVIENVADYDIYENQIVVGFLFSLHQMAVKLLKRANWQIERYSMHSNQVVPDGYVVSSIFIFNIGKQRLEMAKEELNRLIIQIENLYNLYNRFLPVKKVLVQFVPKPTAVFMAIKPYRIIYNLIVEWFEYGIYDFSNEDFILPLLRNHKIYEYYLLLQMCNYLLEEGCTLYQTKKFPYANINEQPYNQFSINTPNTFYFQKEDSDKKITVYYEPVIQGQSHIGENEIGLYRNNSISAEGKTGSYYRPDYLIKVQFGDLEKYLILDAKFSKAVTARKRYFPGLVYKYLFSLSPIKDTTRISGLCILSGKFDGKKDNVFNYYDYAQDLNSIFPTAQIATVTECEDDAWTAHLTIFRKIIGDFIQ